MSVHVYVFLLVICLFLSLALLWHLSWFHLRPSSSRGGAKRSTLQRLLKPRSPDDCPCAGYMGHPFAKFIVFYERMSHVELSSQHKVLRQPRIYASMLLACFAKPCTYLCARMIRACKWC